MEIRGLDQLIGGLNKRANLDIVKSTVTKNGADLDKRMKRNASFTRGYQTGTTKRSITTTLSDGGFTSTTKPNTHYSAYLEYGTRYMSAQPFVKPSFDVQKVQFLNDMKRLMK